MEPGQKTQNNSPLAQPQPKTDNKAQRRGRLGYRRVRWWRSAGRLQKLAEIAERIPLLGRMIVLTRQVTSIRKKDPDLKEGDFWVEEELPVDINKLQGIVEDSAIAQLPYDLNWDRVREAETSLNRSSVNAPGGQGLRLTRHQPESGIFHMLMDMKSREDAEVKDKLFKGLRLSPSGVLFDETTGLSALMVRSRNDNQLKVHNFLVENDPVNTPKGYKLFHKQFKLGLIGKRTIIKGQKETGKNSLYGRHSWSHLHYVAAVKKRYRQLPEPQKPFPNRPFDKE